jgi:hypothetical protein
MTKALLPTMPVRVTDWDCATVAASKIKNGEKRIVINLLN